MANYAVGDVQGCLAELCDVLERLKFDRARDTLWCVGDLVNRGPDSLGVLRFVRDLGARVVLGNHDLHLIATALGVREPKPADTFEDVLNAPDRGQLIDWLRSQPLLHYDAALAVCMVHAGIPPAWDLQTAIACAAELQCALKRDECYADLYDSLPEQEASSQGAELYSSQPAQWSSSLQGAERWRYISNALTRMRYVERNGALALKAEHLPGKQPPWLLPWFEFPERRTRSTTIVFGHWSSLALTDAPAAEYNVWPLDTGCVWGRSLTAMRLEDRQHYAAPSRQPRLISDPTQPQVR